MKQFYIFTQIVSLTVNWVTPENKAVFLTASYLTLGMECFIFAFMGLLLTCNRGPPVNRG